MTRLRCAVASCVFAAILASCAAPPVPPERLSAEDAYRRGVELAHERGPAQARPYFERVLHLNPEDDLARAALVWALASDGKRPDAWALLLEAQRARPGSVHLMRARGDLQLGEGATELALADYLAAYRGAPDDMFLRDRVVDARLLLKQWTGVQAQLQADCKRDPRRVARCTPSTLGRLAQVMLLQGDAAASSELWAETARHQIQEGRVLLWKYAADRRHLGDEQARAALRTHERLIPPGVWRDWVQALLQGQPIPAVPSTSPARCELMVLAELLAIPATSAGPPMDCAAPALDPIPCANNALRTPLRDQHRNSHEAGPGR